SRERNPVARRPTPRAASANRLARAGRRADRLWNSWCKAETPAWNKRRETEYRVRLPECQRIPLCGEDHSLIAMRACLTCSACPLARTLGQWCATFPSGSIKTVERITPSISRPYIFLVPQAPYFSSTFLLGSLRSVTFSEYLSWNFLSAGTGSGLIPTISASISVKSRIESVNSHASVVQPGVSALG